VPTGASREAPFSRRLVAHACGEAGHHSTVQCAFCGEPVEDALTAVICSARLAHESERPTQQLWFHAQCLADRLHASVPFDAEAFTD